MSVKRLGSVRRGREIRPGDTGGWLVLFAERLVALHRKFEAAALPHAFGGAIALAFCTAEPRATRDIDVNVFLPVEAVDRLIDALPVAIVVSDVDRRQLERDGQTRLWWDDTPVDIFLSNHPFHDHAEAARRFVPYADVERLPVLSCADLAVFKAFFARPKDAVDVATMVSSGSIDVDDVERTVAHLLGDERVAFFERVRESDDRLL